MLSLLLVLGFAMSARADDPVILAGDGVTVVIREVQQEQATVKGEVYINGGAYPFEGKIEEAGDSEIVRGAFNAGGKNVGFISRQDENSEATLLTIDQKTYRLIPTDQMPAAPKPVPPPPAPIKPVEPAIGQTKPFNPWGGGDAKPSNAAAPAEPVLRFSLHKFHDISMGNVVSHTVLLPEGWTAEGFVQWSTSPAPYPQQRMRILSPKKGRVAYVPLYAAMYTESKPLPGFPQIPAQGTPPPRDIGQWLVSFLTQGDAAVSDMQVIEDRRDHQAEAAAARTAQAVNGQPGGSREVHVITLSYLLSGERYREEVMLAYDILPPIDNQNIRSDTWTVTVFYMLAAPEAVFDSHKPELIRVANTLVQTPKWFTQVQLTLMELANRRAEEFANTIKQRAAFYDSMTKDQEKAFDDRMAAMDKDQDTRIKTIYERTDYKDVDGGKVRLPSHYDHVYTDGKGNYVLTNTTQHKPGETWTEIEPHNQP